MISNLPNKNFELLTQKNSYQEFEEILNRNNNLFLKHGYSPLSLGWTKGKQDIRFYQLTSMFDLQNKSILDIGCGFGDLYKYLKAKSIQTAYTGVELAPIIADKARELWEGDKNVKILTGNFLDCDFDKAFDFAFVSGTFNYRVEDNYKYVEECMAKTYDLVREGLAFDFLSDRVTIPQDPNSGHFHYTPWRMLEMAYGFSRNVVLLNNALPFEFTLLLFKDNSFEMRDTIFNYYKSNPPNYSNTPIIS